MEVKTDGYVGKDRRSNGRLRLTIGNWITICTIAVAIIGGGVRVQMTARANSIAIEEVKDTPLQVAVIQEKVGNIEEDVNEIRTEQKIMTQDIKNIQSSMNTGFLNILKEIKNNR